MSCALRSVQAQFITGCAPSPIQSISCNNCLLFVISSNGTQNRMNWRHLVKDCIPKISKVINPFFWFGQLFGFEMFFLGIWVHSA